MTTRILTDTEIFKSGLLQKWQKELILSKIKIKIMVASRQTGKSVALKGIVLKEALEVPGTDILLLCSTLKQSKAIHFRPLFLSNSPVFDKSLIKTLNKTDLTVELHNGSTITCASCENIDALRGRTANYVLIDEAGHVDLENVMEVLQPVISARNGNIVMIGTPSGKAHPFYKYVQKGLLNSPFFTKGVRTWIIPIDSDDVVVPNKELRIAQAQSILSPEQFAQEYLCSFDSLSGLVYKNFDPVKNISLLNLDESKPLFIGMDMNVNPMSAVVCQRIVKEENGKRYEELHVIDEVVLNNSNTQAMADEINRRYSKWKGRIFVYADASGKSRRTSADMNTTDHTILRSAGFNLQSPSRNPAITDRVNNLNAKICNARGDRQLFVSNRCKQTVLCLTSQVYDDNGQPDKKNNLDHLPDALGYIVSGLYPIIGNTANIQYGFGR